MKQIVIMLVCIVLIFSAGIAEIKYLNKTSIYLNSDIEYIKNAVENNNYELAAKQMETTYSSWQNIKSIWGIIILHDELDDIEEAIIELKENIKFEDENECLLAIEKIKSDIEHTVKRQKLCIDNIL